MRLPDILAINFACDFNRMQIFFTNVDLNDVIVFLCSLKQRMMEVVNEADLYSAFIEVPYTQGAQVRVTQCYLQTTPYLPLPRKHSPDGASQTEVADI